MTKSSKWDPVTDKQGGFNDFSVLRQQTQHIKNIRVKKHLKISNIFIEQSPMTASDHPLLIVYHMYLGFSA